MSVGRKRENVLKDKTASISSCFVIVQEGYSRRHKLRPWARAANKLIQIHTQIAKLSKVICSISISDSGKLRYSYCFPVDLKLNNFKHTIVNCEKCNENS